MWVRSISIFSLVFALTKLYSQNSLSQKQFVLSQRSAKQIDTNVIAQTNFKNLSNLQNKGYLLATSDSISFTLDSTYFYYTLGPMFKWSIITSDFNTLRINAHNQLHHLYTQGKNISKFELGFKRIINYYENNGFPFALAAFDSISIKDSLISAKLVVRKGPKFSFDTINMPNVNGLKQKFISAYLKIRNGQKFDQSKVDAISKQLKLLPYIQLKENPYVEFYKNKAFVILPIQIKKVNQVDGIVGLLPNSRQANTRPLLTGEFNIALRNLFASGKTFKGEWRRFQPESQLLNVSYYHPVLLKSNIDLALELDLVKQDSSFLNIYRKLAFAYEIPKVGKITFFTALRTSRVGSTNAFKSSQRLSNTVDFDYLSYGIGFDYFDLDNYFQPKQGNRIFAQIAIGNKNVIKNTSVERQAIYDSVSLSSVQVNASLNFEKYVLFTKKLVLANELKFKCLFNNQNNLFINDLYRFGGVRSIRGFNENFFYASNYVVLSSEIRKYIDQSSYLLAFANTAFYDQQLKTTYSQDYPIGFGAGVSFSTKAGQFSFIYALGKSKEQDINFNQSKVHIGLISSF